jgi:hypothetical protein
MNNKINNLPNFSYTPPPPPCPAIDMGKYKRHESIEKSMYMGASGEDHFRQYMSGLYRLVTYRAEVAKQLKKAGGEFEAKALEDLFDYCNNELKEYLAIL